MKRRIIVKKLLVVVLSLIMILAVVPIGTFSAFAETYSGSCGANVTWEYNSSTATLSIHGTGLMNDYKDVYSNALRRHISDAPWSNYCDSILRVLIDSGVTSIGSYAFRSCTILNYIKIPESVTSIGDCAFEGCEELTGIIIPDSVTYIGRYAFYFCGKITNIIIPDGVTSIEDHTFHYCQGLTTITIPDRVKSIGEYAFNECIGLKTVLLPKSIKTIGEGAFDGCTGLTSITIPDGLTVINWLNGCTGLTSITIPDSVTSIKLEGCIGLKSITIPDSITAIEPNAFSGCTGLTSFVIPKSVTSIGYSAFSNCTGLTSIAIPHSVTSIDVYAFAGCENLETVYFCGTEEQWRNIRFGRQGATYDYNYNLREAKRIYHLYNEDWRISVAPTCNDIGVEYRTCSICGEDEARVIPASGHDYKVLNAKAATCTEYGYTGDTYCTNCGEKITDGTVLNALGHTESDWVIDLEPQIGVAGSKHKECTICRKVLETAEIPELESPVIPDENAPQIVVESVRARAGKTVDVKISLNNNPGITSAKITVIFSEELVLSNVIFGGLDGQSILSETYSSPLTLNWFNGLEILETSDVVFATLTFTVPENAEIGKKDIVVQYDAEDIFNINEENIEFVTVNGSIDVLNHIAGDINDDGAVNNKDITRLFQYLTGWNVYVNEAALDVNNDKKVNNKDLTRLFQYLSNWDVEIF